MGKLAIELPLAKIKIFCKKWKIKEFSFFGSVLRDDFDPKTSDIDILVVFYPDVELGWEFMDMQEELVEIFGRQVDLIEKRVIENSSNPHRKQSILDSYEVAYEQAG